MTRAVVTGAAGGIGAAICRRLAAEGLEVIATDLEGADVRLDITDHAAAAALAERLGPVDVLVNNAGWDRVMPFLETDAELWERVIRVNLLGPIGVTHAFARGMAERGSGRIVNIASDAGRVGSSGEVVYSAAKGGVIAFTKGLARELARYKVNVNCVCPGPTDTPMLGIFEERGQGIIESMTKAVPFRRLAQPDEIAAAVAFLASDDAAYITGQTLSVSGGLTMA
ncbi:MAG TPA: SDR family oxidoreductase [Candidatus Dormibacteraeota bacterium]